MTTLAHRVVAVAAASKARRVAVVSLAAIAVTIGVSAALAYGQFSSGNFAPSFVNNVITRVAADLAVLDQRWRRGREAIAANRRSSRGNVQCVVYDDPRRHAAEIASRIEAGQRVSSQCLEVRIDDENTL